MMDSNPDEILRKYTGLSRKWKALGEGANGRVFHSGQSTALKIFTHREKFNNELAVYQRLKENRVSRVLGFSVPQLIRENKKLLVIEMTIVEPPYILDFAQSELDADHTFDDLEERHREWWDRIAQDFGEDLPIAQAVFYHLAENHGVYHYDLAPRNIAITNAIRKAFRAE